MPSRTVTLGADYFTTRSRLDEHGCLVWLGYCQPDGYPKLTVRRNGEQLAHRAAYRIFVGEIPDGYQVDHLCFNRACVNPLHLELVTPQENSERATAKITHCPHGHAYTESNTYYPPGRKRRMCRACRAAASPHKEKERSAC